MSNTRRYTVSQDKKTGLWYAHKAGFDWIPIFGTFCDTRRQAQTHAAHEMGMSLKEYLKLKEPPRKKMKGCYAIGKTVKERSL